MSSTKPPSLHVVNGNNNRAHAPKIDYRTLVLTSAVTTAVAILATIGVQWVLGRAKKLREPSTPQQQLPAFTPMPMSMQMQNPMQSALMHNGMMYMPVAGPGMGMQRFDMNPDLPQALQFPPEMRRKHVAPAANSGQPPEWFAAFAKQQSDRFSRLEQQIADGYEVEEEAV